MNMLKSKYFITKMIKYLNLFIIHIKIQTISKTKKNQNLS